MLDVTNTVCFLDNALTAMSDSNFIPLIVDLVIDMSIDYDPHEFRAAILSIPLQARYKWSLILTVLDAVIFGEIRTCNKMLIVE